MFRNLFLLLVPDTTQANRVVHADPLSTTTIAPARSTAEAVSVLKELGQVDLVELYGGFGFDTAAAVLTAAPGVPVGFPGRPLPPVPSAVLFEDPNAGPGGIRWQFGATTVMAIPSTSDAPTAAAELVAAGAERIELCGGMGPIPAAAVQAVVDVPVTTVLFGFESLPPAAAYRANFEAALVENAMRVSSWRRGESNP
jgi:hypothetical protein